MNITDFLFTLGLKHKAKKGPEIEEDPIYRHKCEHERADTIMLLLALGGIILSGYYAFFY